MPQIIPIKDLRNTSELSEMVNLSNEPIFVTKNGYGEMVIMSMTAYEEKMAILDMKEKILEGKTEADNGYLLNGEQVMRELRDKYVK